MNNTMARIGILQARLNDLVNAEKLCTEDTSELYTLSLELDKLIVEYYRDISK